MMVISTPQRRPLSSTQSRILAALRHHYEATGFPMTLRGLMAACNISTTSVVAYNLDRLEEDGLVKRNTTGVIPTGYLIVQKGGDTDGK